RALAEGERLLAMVETALRITRAEARIGKESFTPVDLAVELEEIAEIYGPVAEDAGRAIRVAIAAPATLPLHRELLGQALGNLVDNALKY
ncbi:sensor histidine kinase, partial [Enterococcus faecium]